jgi:hypothetical protein
MDGPPSAPGIRHPALVGIIANPASGKDIRRLVAHGSTFDNNEKINIVRRVLLGLDAVGVERVRYMPDGYAIVERAAASVELRLDLAPLPMPVLGNAGDSLEASRRLVDLGAACIVTLGGDGTNRVVAKGCGDVPLVPISTGTNNVFPRMVEGTLAGLAAGLVACGLASNDGTERVIRRLPRLDVRIDGEVRDQALIDVVTSRQGVVGARALWDPGHLREVVLSLVSADGIGLCALGGALFPDACGGCAGVRIIVGDHASDRRAIVPLAPGLIREVPIASATLLKMGESAELRPEPCVVALDGERELELPQPVGALSVTLDPGGPRVVEIAAALRAGATRGAFVRGASGSATGFAST